MKASNFSFFKTAIALCGGIFLFTACSSDEPNAQDQQVAAQITATIEGTGTNTRAAGTAWAAGDAIGITTSNSSKQYTNIKYTTASGDGSDFTGTPIYFQDVTNTVTFNAYYPYAGTEGTAAGVLTSDTRIDKQSTDVQPTIDYMWDTKAAAYNSPEVDFQFAHKMSKLTITLQDGSDTDVSKTASYTVSGLVMDGTFDTATGVAAADVTTATAEDLIVDLTGTSIVSGSTLPSLILYPQQTQSDIVLTISLDGQQYKCTLMAAGVDMEAGNDYNYTIKVNKKAATITASGITAWSTQTSTGTAEM